ncbi:MAG: phosphotransferase [Nanoarchaeota archaeon]
MFETKQKIKEYIEQLSPEVLKISEVSVRDITLLGSGESNLNYLVDLGSKKVVFRLHLEDNTRDKPKKEYLILKKIECLNIAPKALLYDISNTEGSFIILEYVDGNALPSDYQLSDKQFLTLAKELAVLHSSSVNSGVPKNKFSYSGYLARFEADIEYIKRKLQIGKIKDTFVETLYKIDAVMRKDVRENKVKNLFSMTHGDIAPQNMVETDSGFKFIDW